ncbi:hypothetical protein AMECASPLE_039610, partial [Ameca splendens]
KMGNNLEGDVKFMESYVKAAREICKRWQKKKYGFPGNLITTEILKLQGDLKLEIMHLKDPETVKTLPDYNFKGDLSVPACTQLINRLKQKDELKKTARAAFN